ncbi:GNAT family N-acetyltransferase [Arthrobacter sp. M4]|uniref:GNAT family N-acetyltransferase n=1 Tax=Arthrobacter sp. M4 TaxID=218160 RepID=UPI001CDB7B5A|nr:GNAT family protein [Arthrobacter sp. M4]MCA4134694.1 GNAT family N-acetyltransferase [Arthrobacter sp. M4]
MQHDVALYGHGIRLVPLSPLHAGPLFDFVDSGIWAGMAAKQPLCPEELAQLFAARLDDAACIPFAVTDDLTGSLLGTTSICDYEPKHQRLEIGGTFYGRQFWGSHVNPASKRLLLEYAFEVLGIHRVAFRCDARNTRSASAISRLGATYEGTLRGNRPSHDGGWSDTAVFSILENEWPALRGLLQERLTVSSAGWAA